MSFQSYLPPVSGEASVVFALLAAMSDPDKYKEMMNKLLVEKQAIETARDEQAKLKKESDQAVKDAADKLAEAIAQRSENQRTAEQLQTKENQLADNSNHLAAREADLRAEKQKHNDAAVELEKTRAAYAGRESQLVARAKALDARHAEIERREKALAESERKHKQWIDSLKPPGAG